MAGIGSRGKSVTAFWEISPVLQKNLALVSVWPCVLLTGGADRHGSAGPWLAGESFKVFC